MGFPFDWYEAGNKEGLQWTDTTQGKVFNAAFFCTTLQQISQLLCC
jgi:hypothetical protein